MTREQAMELAGRHDQEALVSSLRRRKIACGAAIPLGSFIYAAAIGLVFADKRVVGMVLWGALLALPALATFRLKQNLARNERYYRGDELTKRQILRESIRFANWVLFLYLPLPISLALLAIVARR